MARVLVVDDSKLDRTLVTQILGEDRSLSIETVPDGAEALRAVASRPPDLVLTDLVMPELDGLELVKRLRADHHGLPVILMTSQGSEEMDWLRIKPKPSADPGFAEKFIRHFRIFIFRKKFKSSYDDDDVVVFVGSMGAEIKQERKK